MQRPTHLPAPLHEQGRVGFFRIHHDATRTMHLERRDVEKQRPNLVRVPFLIGGNVKRPPTSKLVRARLHEFLVHQAIFGVAVLRPGIGKVDMDLAHGVTGKKTRQGDPCIVLDDQHVVYATPLQTVDQAVDPLSFNFNGDDKAGGVGEREMIEKVTATWSNLNDDRFRFINRKCCGIHHRHFPWPQRLI